MAFTFFFRDNGTLDLIAEHVIPNLKNRRYINIWDAGCAMGPEPYSLAIILHENMGPFMFRNVKIHATDIDGSNLFEKIIREGVYPDEQIQRIPETIRRKYFSKNGTPDHSIISEELRRCVEYTRHDLLSLEPIKEGLELIVCKNVLLHFKEVERIEVIRMFHGALGDGGYLVMEQTQKLPRKLSELFEPVVGNAQIFRKVNC